MLPARKTTSRLLLPANADTLRLVTITSPGTGATAGWTRVLSLPSMNRPVPATAEKVLFRALASG
jgi:hypothetical protein